jgi:hypothetical protein
MAHLADPKHPAEEADAGCRGNKGGAIRADTQGIRFGDGTVLGIARKLGVHCRMVRQALANAEPPARE